MFTFQTMTGKRERDDESDSDLHDERRHVKKSYSGYHHQFSHTPSWNPSPPNLPYRPSLTPSPSSNFVDTGPVTPAQSEHGAGVYTAVLNLGGPALHPRSSGMDFDTDMDQDDSEVQSQSPFLVASQNLMRPAMLKPSLFNSDTINSTGRVSTPMHPTFKRGGINRGYPMNGFREATNENSGSMFEHALSTQLPSAWQGNSQEIVDDGNGGRRMPSPISEDEDIPDTPTDFTQSQLSRLSFSNANAPDDMDTEHTSPPLGLAAAPTPRGRKRSGALTGVGRFTMGYRDDCEKCRQRVPGHYSHFLP